MHCVRGATEFVSSVKIHVKIHDPAAQIQGLALCQRWQSNNVRIFAFTLVRFAARNLIHIASTLCRLDEASIYDFRSSSGFATLAAIRLPHQEQGDLRNQYPSQERCQAHG
jgi:hypothetical protein